MPRGCLVSGRPNQRKPPEVQLLRQAPEPKWMLLDVGCWCQQTMTAAVILREDPKPSTSSLSSPRSSLVSQSTRFQQLYSGYECKQKGCLENETTDSDMNDTTEPPVPSSDNRSQKYTSTMIQKDNSLAISPRRIHTGLSAQDIRLSRIPSSAAVIIVIRTQHPI